MINLKLDLCFLIVFSELMSAIPVSCGIITIMLQEIIVNFPEHMKGDTSKRAGDLVVGFVQHTLKIIQWKQVFQQFMGQLVTFNQLFKFLMNKQKCTRGLNWWFHYDTKIWPTSLTPLLFTTTPVRSSASNLEMATSNAFSMAALIRWPIRCFRSMDRPRTLKSRHVTVCDKTVTPVFVCLQEQHLPARSVVVIWFGIGWLPDTEFYVPVFDTLLENSCPT